MVGLICAIAVVLAVSHFISEIILDLNDVRVFLSCEELRQGNNYIISEDGRGVEFPQIVLEEDDVLIIYRTMWGKRSE